MSIPSVYINLEDDVEKVLTRLKHNRAAQVILVCPKRCFLFSSAQNLVDLKDQTNSLGKEVFVLTMDERGQQYAQDAGFQLKFLPKAGGGSAASDIKFSKRPTPAQSQQIQEQGMISQSVRANPPLRKPSPVIFSKEDLTALEPIITTKNSTIIPKVEISDSIFPVDDDVTELEEGQKEKSPTGKIITGVVAISLIALLLLAFVILPKATVIVYPRTEPVTRDMDISMSVAVSSIDTSKLIIPATKIDEAATVNASFQSQGKQQIGNKAVGTVKIYNFTKLPLNLKASTTTLNVGSKSYNLVNDVQGLKPTTYKNAKTKEVDVSSLGDSVEVIATQGGEDFNLPEGTRLEITNQVLGSKPLVLYAKTDAEISGGTTRYLSLISQDDSALAQTQLQDQALEQIRAKLKANGLVLRDKAFTPQIAQFILDNPVGTQTPNFHATLQIKVSGLAYKQKDLDDLIKQRITQTLSANKTLQPKTPQDSEVSIKAFDSANQIASMNVHYEGQAVYDLDLPDLSPELVGKSRNQANEILRSKAEIDRVDITLAPVWQKNFPWFASKIDVHVAN
jgi:hypothetical protein